MQHWRHVTFFENMIILYLVYFIISKLYQRDAIIFLMLLVFNAITFMIEI